MRIFIIFIILMSIPISVFSEDIFNPYTHRKILIKNMDKSATLEMVNRNPQRFENYRVGFSGHILKIKERGKKEIRTFLLCSNLKEKFIVVEKGKSDRYTLGIWIEAYGSIKKRKTPFNLELPVVEAVRVLTPNDVQKDFIRKKDLNYFLLAEKNGGFLKFGKKLLKKKFYRDSDIIFKFGLEYDKNNKKELYYYQLALLNFIEKKFRIAKKYSQLAIHKNMDMVEAQFLLGKIEIKLQNYPLALRYFNRSIKLKSKENPWKYISEVYYLKNMFKVSLKYINVAITINPEDDELNLMAGNINLKLGFLETAAAYYKKYLQKYPNSKEVLYNLRMTQKIEKHFEKKIKISELEKYNKILRKISLIISPEYNPLNKIKFSYRILEKELIWAVKYREGNYKLYNYLGILNLYRKRFDIAQKFFELALKWEKNSSILYYNFAFSNYYLNKFDKSIENFEIAYKLNNFMKRASNYKKSIIKIKELLTKNSRSEKSRERSKIHKEFGEYLYTKGELIQSEFNYIESLRYRNDNFGTLFDIAYLKLKSNNREEADLYIKKLFRKNKNSNRYIKLLLKSGYSEKELINLGYKKLLDK